ncbi:hypothetical protein D3C83_135670 [compost metagenome]
MLDGELGARRPLLDLGIELGGLGAKLLFGGHAAHDFLTSRTHLLLHLAERLLDGFSRVVRLVEQ